MSQTMRYRGRILSKEKVLESLRWLLEYGKVTGDIDKEYLAKVREIRAICRERGWKEDASRVIVKYPRVIEETQRGIRRA